CIRDRANMWGKVKTVVQIGAIAVLISPLSQSHPTMALALFWLAVLLTWWSGLIYLTASSKTP
ncbi:CDP-diacylglycerol--glycerol-3-phosphate 3-phosphatidyltransferase, partial [Leptolyngbya cf. ectocarpi LEGE 11479]|nr:CDP-diacylglycerol--glycerol-3-phosphate 3-phosphatidyltransferase [Leptolyngbya cf. ectocarpi LEGE 11479]